MGQQGRQRGTGPYRRVDAIQALRALAVTMVIGRHVLRFMADTRVDTGTAADALLTGDAGVDVFFVVSGFVMGWTSSRRLGRRDAIKPFLVDRATRIYPLYWVVTMALYAVVVAAPDKINRLSEGASLSLSHSLLLLPDYQQPIVGQAWSLVHEVYFYLVFALLLAVPRRLLPAGLAVWAALPLATALISGGADLPGPYLDVVLHPLTLEFIAGVVVALVGRRVAAHPAAAAAGALGVAALVAVGAVHATVWGDQPLGLTRVATYGVMGLLLVIGALWWDDHRPTPSVLLRIGDASYATYLSHVIVIGAVTELLPMPAAIGAQVAVGAGLVVLCLVAGELFHRIVERPLVRWARTRSGRDVPVAVAEAGA